MIAPDNFLFFISLFTINIGCATYLLFTYNRTRIVLFNALAFLILAARTCSEYYLPQIGTFEEAQFIARIHSFIFIEFVIIWACTWWYIRPFKKHLKEQLFNKIYGGLLFILHLPFIPLLYYRIPFKLYPEKIDGYWKFYWDYSTNSIYYYYSVILLFVLINLSLLILDTLREKENRILKIILILFYSTIPLWIIMNPLSGAEQLYKTPSGIINHMIPALIASWFFTNYRLFRDTSIDVIGDTFDSISDVVLFVDLEYTVLQANSEAKDVFQLDITTSNLIGAVASNSRMIASEVKNILDRLIEEPNKEEEVQLHVRGADALFTAKSANYFKGGKLIGYTFFIKDITAERKSELQLAAQHQQLQKLNKIKDHIFAIIGHDLRKPAIAFRGITKKVNYLLQKQDYKTLSQLGNTIEEEALALNKLTDNLLNWALMQKNVMPYNPSIVRLSDIIDENFQLFKNTAIEKKLNLSSDISPHVQVYADRGAVNTIFRNLLDNAIKYTDTDGEVEIFAVESDTGVKIHIKDTGIGIPAEKLPYIFHLQNNKSEEGTAGEKGTGLGLHLVHELVKLNKGSLGVASRVGKGTSFELILPTRGLRLVS